MSLTARWAALILLSAVPGIAAQQALSVEEAESLRQKLQLIVDRGAADSAPGARPLVTSVSEREVNAYFRFAPSGELPVGLVNPTIAIFERGRVSVRANIDLDALRKSKPRGTLDPLAYVSGIVEAVIAGTLEATRGRGKFVLESATLAGVAVPESIVGELVTYLTRTADNPAGISLNEPFALPARIQQIRTGAGQATIVQ